MILDHINKWISRFGSRAVSLFLLVGFSGFVLIACGDSNLTNTPQPQTTTSKVAPTASSSTSSSGAASTTTIAPTSGSGVATSPQPTTVNSSGSGGVGSASPGGNAPAPPLLGTITGYDANAKVLSVSSSSDGSSQKFNVLPNSRINKPVKITLAELATLANGTNNITVMGQKEADGSYTASALTIIDQASMLAAFGPNNPAGGNNGARPAASPGSGGGTGAGGGNPNAGQGQGQGGGGAPRAGNPNGGAIQVLRGTLSGNKVSGTDLSGTALTVNLNDTTILVKLIAGSLEDLKAGTKVSIISRPSQAQDNSGVATAAVINLVQP